MVAAPKMQAKPAPKAKAKVSEGEVPSSGRRSKQNFPEVAPARTPHFTRVNQTPKACCTPASLKGMPCAVKRVSNFGEAFTSLANRTVHSARGRCVAESGCLDRKSAMLSR